MRNIFILIAFLFPLGLLAQKPIKVLATNSWTAAYVRAAGIENVEQLAPSSLAHPAEYELQMGDVDKIKNADLIVYAGYEVVVSQIKQSLKLDEKKFLKIETGYAESQMVSEIQKIAIAVGTQEQAKASVAAIHKLFADARVAADNAGLKGKPVIAHFFQQAYVKEIGLNPVAVFGPSPLELHNLSDLSKKEAVLIVDNAHNPIAQPLAEIKKGVRCVELLNFPGMKNTSSLEDVIEYNLSQLLKR